MSRTKDEDDNTAYKECNTFKPDYAVDIHNNAGGGDGAEVFHHYGGGKSKSLAQNILNAIVAIGQNSRGLKTKKNVWGKDYFAFIRETVCPAVIVECCFLDNKKDVQIIDTTMEQKDIGKAIAKGILKELGIAWKEEKKVENTTTSKKLYKVQVGSYSVKANADAMVKKLKAAGFDAIIV
jgi:N-acetylmuramoyl-L-alanine amidase